MQKFGNKNLKSTNFSVKASANPYTKKNSLNWAKIVSASQYTDHKHHSPYKQA